MWSYNYYSQINKAQVELLILHQGCRTGIHLSLTSLHLIYCLYIIQIVLSAVYSLVVVCVSPLSSPSWTEANFITTKCQSAIFNQKHDLIFHYIEKLRMADRVYKEQEGQGTVLENLEQQRRRSNSRGERQQLRRIEESWGSQWCDRTESAGSQWGGDHNDLAQGMSPKQTKQTQNGLVLVPVFQFKPIKTRPKLTKQKVS